MLLREEVRLPFEPEGKGWRTSAGEEKQFPTSCCGGETVAANGQRTAQQAVNTSSVLDSTGRNFPRYPGLEFRAAITPKCHKGELIPCFCVFRLLSLPRQWRRSPQLGLVTDTLQTCSKAPQTPRPPQNLLRARAQVASDSLVLVF